MVELNKQQAKSIEEIFGYTEETLILSFIQGHMGRGWADDLSNPSCAQILVGDFCYVAGDYNADGAETLVRNIPSYYKKPALLMVPQNEAWGRVIEACHQGKLSKFTRYAIKKEKDCFSREKLHSYIEMLPARFKLARIDEDLYYRTSQLDFAKDFCSNFSSAEDYLARGLGFCVLDGDEIDNDNIVCGASSYSVYDNGIEIEIATKKEYRRQGLAVACAAKLILECMDRDIYPSWDAANMASVALAEKLGYHFDYEYDTYEIDCTGLND